MRNCYICNKPFDTWVWNYEKKQWEDHPTASKTICQDCLAAKANTEQETKDARTAS